MPERHTIDSFPKALAKLMKERGIDQLRLSGLARMNQSSVSRYLDGLRKPSLASMEKVAAALDVSPEFFLEYRIEKVREIMEERPEVVSGLYEGLVYQLSEKQHKTPASQAQGVEGGVRLCRLAANSSVPVKTDPGRPPSLGEHG